MKKYISIVLLISFFSINGQAQEIDYRHNIQIGRSAFYFGDQPLSIGKNGIGIASGFWMYIPYISYTYHYHPRFFSSISFEEWSSSYSRKSTDEGGEISGRFFYQYQLNQNVTLFQSNRITLNGKFIAAYRGSASEYTVYYFDRGSWVEGYGVSNKINGLGGGLGVEIDYRFHKRISVALKAEYLRYSAKRGEIDFGKYPKNQQGFTLSLGYHFGKTK